MPSCRRDDKQFRRGGSARRRVLDMILALLAGCETGPMPPSVDDRDSAIDSGDLTTDWQPGDPVPGWDDYECVLPFELDEQTTYLDSELWEIGGEFAYRDGIQTASAYVGFGECWGACSYYDDDASLPGVEEWSLSWGAGFDSNFGKEWFSGSFPCSERATASGYAWVDDVSYYHECYDTYNPFSYPVPLEVCISIFRPDRIKGIAYMDISEAEGNKTGFDYVYAGIDQVLAPHAAYYHYESWKLLDEEQAPYAFQYYDLSYDEHWPWDDITDPAIRQVLHDTYTPVDPENEPVR